MKKVWEHLPAPLHLYFLCDQKFSMKIQTERVGIIIHEIGKFENAPSKYGASAVSRLSQRKINYCIQLYVVLNAAC